MKTPLTIVTKSRGPKVKITKFGENKHSTGSDIRTYKTKKVWRFNFDEYNLKKPFDDTVLLHIYRKSLSKTFLVP